MTDDSDAMRSITAPMDRLLAIMERLRDPDSGCPWDIEQTFATIAPHTIEEAYEVADAIENGDRMALKDELGDLLLQVVFHSQMACEEKAFSFDDVADAISEKLLRRHPHVFGDETIASADEQTLAWEDLKARERAEKADGKTLHSALDGLTGGLPSMTRALKLQNRAARVGFDWTDAKDIIGKVEEELEEVRQEFIVEAPDHGRLTDEIGDLLFTVVNLARKAGVDPETALRHTNRKFERRFRRVETLLHEQGQAIETATLDTMEAQWGRAKKEEHDHA